MNKVTALAVTITSAIGVGYLLGWADGSRLTVDRGWAVGAAAGSVTVALAIWEAMQ